MLEEGRCVSTRVLAVEKVDASQVVRWLRRRLLAPDIVGAILDGRDANETTPRFLATITADRWAQREAWARRVTSLRRRVRQRQA